MSGWKGFAAGALLMLLAVGLYLFKPEFTWEQALPIFLAGLGIWGIRDKLNRMAVLLVCALALSACTTVHSTKIVRYEPGSVNLHPFPFKLEEVEGQEGGGGEMILPDGTYFTLAGGGSAGNVMILTMQNDGTDQEGASTEAKAAANVNSPDANAGTPPE